MPAEPESAATSRSSAYVTRASLFQKLRQAEPRDRAIAWEVFRARYAPIIAGFAGRFGASRQDIDDIIQDVMAGFVGVSDAFVYDPATGRFRGWLKTCTVRAAIRRAGKNLRFQGVPLEDVPHAELAVEPVWSDVWEAELVAQALAMLRAASGTSVAFQAFEQYALRERSAEEVAAELKTSVENVHQAKSRMTKRLRETVQQLREEEG